MFPSSHFAFPRPIEDASMRHTVPNLRACATAVVVLTFLSVLHTAPAHAAGSSAFGTGMFVYGPAAGSDSILVSAGGAWTAVANDAWLHTSSTGSGNGLAVFSFDGNAGATRTGSITIAGQSSTIV